MEGSGRREHLYELAQGEFDLVQGQEVWGSKLLSWCGRGGKDSSPTTHFTLGGPGMPSPAQSPDAYLNERKLLYLTKTNVTEHSPWQYNTVVVRFPYIRLTLQGRKITPPAPGNRQAAEQGNGMMYGIRWLSRVYRQMQSRRLILYLLGKLRTDDHIEYPARTCSLVNNQLHNPKVYSIELHHG